MPRHAFIPNKSYYIRPVPDLTARYIIRSQLTETVALIAKIRYNRLLDLFVNAITYPLEWPAPNTNSIDDLHFALSRNDERFVVPVLANIENGNFGLARIKRTFARCRDLFPNHKVKPVVVRIYDDPKGEVIVLFQPIIINGKLFHADEKHYRLVPANSISKADLDSMAELSD